MAKQRMSVDEFRQFGKSSGGAGTRIEFGEFYAGTGVGGGVWEKTGVSGLTPGQSPYDLGDWFFTDPLGFEWRLVTSSMVALEKLGFIGCTNAQRTSLVQGLIDNHYLDFSGIQLVSPDGEYYFSKSTLTDYYLDEDGLPNIYAGDACLNVRANCSLLGTEDKCIWRSEEPASVIFLVEPSKTRLEGINYDGAWAGSGAGHGVFLVVTDLNAAITGLRVRKTKVANVGGYGIGINYGLLEDAVIEDIETDNTGADGIDIKTRSPNGEDGLDNTIRDVTVKRFGLRTNGAAGVDIRGTWQYSGIRVVEFGDQTETNGKTGFRLRPESLEAANNVAKLCVGSLVHVEADLNENPGSEGDVLTSNTAGIQMSGYRNILMGFVAKNCMYNLYTLSSEYMRISHGVIEGHGAYGYYSTVSGVGTTLSDVHCANANGATHHLRVEGANHTSRAVTYDDTASGYSTSTAASQTISRDRPSIDHEEYLDQYSSSGRVTLEAKGGSTDIDLALTPKGTGNLRFGTYTVDGAISADGYITIRSATGQTIQLLARLV